MNSGVKKYDAGTLGRETEGKSTKQLLLTLKVMSMTRG